MKKKLVAAVIAAALACFGVMALTACGSSSSSSSSSTDTASSSAASAADYKLVNDGQLTVITSADYEPMEYMENKEIKGFDPALIKAVGEKLGLKVSIKSQSFDSLITAIAGGTSADCAISAITINDDRQKEVDLSDPYYDSNLAVVVMKDSKLKSKEDLNKKGVKVAAQSGSSGEDWAKENCKDASYTPFQETPDMLAALRTGKIDAAIYDDPVAEEHVNGEYNDCKVLEVIPTGEQYGIAVNKDNPGLTAAINQALKELKDDGTIAKIEKEEFSGK